MAVSLTNLQKVMVTATALDSAGNPVGFVEAPVFSLGNDSLAKLGPLSSGDTAPAAPSVGMWLVPVGGATGTDTVSVSENAVVGDTSTAITGTLDYTVTEGQTPDLAASIEVEAGSPVDAGAQLTPLVRKLKKK